MTAKNYKNSFGEINENEISLVVDSREYKIENKNISQIRFIKTQKYHLNFLLVILDFFLIYFLKSHKLSQFIQFDLDLLIIILFAISWHIKYFQYKLLLLKKNDFLLIEISKSISVDVENFVNQFYKIRENR